MLHVNRCLQDYVIFALHRHPIRRRLLKHRCEYQEPSPLIVLPFCVCQKERTHLNVSGGGGDNNNNKNHTKTQTSASLPSEARREASLPITRNHDWFKANVIRSHLRKLLIFCISLIELISVNHSRLSDMTVDLVSLKHSRLSNINVDLVSLKHDRMLLLTLFL